MISVEQWRARIGLFGTKRCSGCRSSLFSSYVPFTFRRGRRDRSTSAQQEPPTEEPPSQHASQPQVNVPGKLDTNPFPPTEKQSVVSLKDEQSWSLSSHFSRCFTSFLYTGLLKSSLLREALIRSVLLMAIISQLLITSGDIEENPGPDPSECIVLWHVVLNFNLQDPVQDVGYFHVHNNLYYTLGNSFGWVYSHKNYVKVLVWQWNV